MTGEFFFKYIVSYIVSEGSVSVVGADVLELFLHVKYEYRHGAQRGEESRAEHFQ